MNKVKPMEYIVSSNDVPGAFPRTPPNLFYETPIKNDVPVTVGEGETFYAPQVLDLLEQIKHDCIALMAYEIWEEEGKPEGRELEHWIAAEKKWNTVSFDERVKCMNLSGHRVVVFDTITQEIK